MNEPYETLLGWLKENPVIGRYLQDEMPDWPTIWTEAMPMLSSGERTMVQIALSMYNGNGTARVADIFSLDKSNQKRVLDALQLRLT